VTKETMLCDNAAQKVKYTEVEIHNLRCD
jgi:hypothetical protein